MPMIISVVIKSFSNMIIRIIVKIIKNTLIPIGNPATQIFKGLWTTMAGFPNAVFFNEASTPDLSTGLKIWRIAHGFVPP